MFININIPGNPYKHRHFCTILEDVFVFHKDKCLSPSTHVEIYHDNKQVIAGLDWDKQSTGNREVYSNVVKTDIKEDEILDSDVFLFHDDAGVNYIHFFFNHLSRLIYFEELRKTNPNLKLGIVSDFYNNIGGKWAFIKEWLDLYYENDPIDIVVFEKNKTYKVKSLILSNCFYGFPEITGYEPMLNMVRKVVDRIEPIEVKANGCYISRQDTIKRGWYHKRELENELELIEKIKSELNYDIIEMMDYSLKEKIQLSKSYNNIIQQSSASNINILFSKKGANNIVIENPKMGPWLNEKCSQFALKSNCNFLVLEEVGELITPEEAPPDTNNYPWRLTDIDGIIDILKKIDDGSIWES